MLAAIQAAGFGGNELCVLVASPRGQTGQTGVPLIEQTMTGHNPGATPLYAAACGGSLRCAKLLCEAGAKIDARTQNDASPLLVSCQVRARHSARSTGRTAPARSTSATAQRPRGTSEAPHVVPQHISAPPPLAPQNGHMGVAMLLSSYGAPRDVICTTYSGVDACSAATPASSDAEALAEEGGHTELLRWLVESRRYSPLHHVQALTAERALELLRAGHSPLARHHSSCKSAADIAAEHPRSPAAATILRAAAPWTPATHGLWGAGARARAAELCKLGYMLARHVDDLPGCRGKGSIQGALVDAWIGHVVPQAVTWELQ